MALHHIRDSKGNLHYFNDEEYRQYLRDKRRTGCFVFLIIAAFQMPAHKLFTFLVILRLVNEH